MNYRYPTAGFGSVVRPAWDTLYMSCNIDTYNNQPVSKKWDFTPVQTQLIPTPSLVSNFPGFLGNCLTQTTINSALIGQFSACEFGNPLQYWIYNSNKQITNGQGLCVASYPPYPDLAQMDACQADPNHTWEIVGNGQAIINSATQYCLDSACGPDDYSFYFIPGMTPTPTPTPTEHTPANRPCKHNSRSVFCR